MLRFTVHCSLRKMFKTKLCFPCFSYSIPKSLQQRMSVLFITAVAGTSQIQEAKRVPIDIFAGNAKFSGVRAVRVP